MYLVVPNVNVRFFPFFLLDPKFFVPNAEIFLISQSKNYSCINLTLVDDNIIEDTSVFKVFLMERFGIPTLYLQNYNEIIFEDDDGMQIHVCNLPYVYNIYIYVYTYYRGYRCGG